jgi:secondary thiamine-phosphate synthase enzyme
MKEIRIQSQARNELIDVTSKVEKILEKMDIKKGHVMLYVPHTTAGITINEGADPSVQRDIITTLSRLIPQDGNYHHFEGNSDAHIKSSLLGCSVLVPVENNKPVLGTWQRIFFYEGDGPRSRKIFMHP